MKPFSIKSRLLGLAAVWIAIAWIGGALTLSHAFTEAVESRFDVKVSAELSAVTSAIRADADPDGFGIRLDTLTEPKFDQPGSGWYWQIKTNEKVLLRSPSLRDSVLPLDLSVAPDEIWFSTDHGPDGASVRAAQTQVALPGGRIATVKVALNDQEVREEISSFDTQIMIGLGLLGLALTFAILLQVQIGMEPLRRLARELERFQAGEQDGLTGTYPTEITKAVEAINEVLGQNRKVVQRARQSASNLAHALKTELALLNSRTVGDDGTEAPDEVRRHIERIAQIVDHHLNRAATIGPAVMAPERVQAASVVQSICDALRRIYDVRNITLDCHIAGAPIFRGERQDLEEMVGNLIENACRHTATRVLVGLSVGDGNMTIRVDDDGPGMTERMAALAVRRGKRLDERSQGSGLGLSIVADLAEMYGGSLSLSMSALGGLLAVLTLPARRTAAPPRPPAPTPLAQLAAPRETVTAA